MSDPDPAGHDAGQTFVRAIVVVACAGSALLTIAMVMAMGRWLI